MIRLYLYCKDIKHHLTTMSITMYTIETLKVQMGVMGFIPENEKNKVIAELIKVKSPEELAELAALCPQKTIAEEFSPKEPTWEELVNFFLGVPVENRDEIMSSLSQQLKELMFKNRPIKQIIKHAMENEENKERLVQLVIENVDAILVAADNVKPDEERKELDGGKAGQQVDEKKASFADIAEKANNNPRAFTVVSKHGVSQGKPPQPNDKSRLPKNNIRRVTYLPLVTGHPCMNGVGTFSNEFHFNGSLVLVENANEIPPGAIPVGWKKFWEDDAWWYSTTPKGVNPEWPKMIHRQKPNSSGGFTMHKILVGDKYVDFSHADFLKTPFFQLLK